MQVYDLKYNFMKNKSMILVTEIRANFVLVS